MTRPPVSRNDPCPCGSGRKFKKCCYKRERLITALDRAMAIELVEDFVESCEERHEAKEEFCDGLDLDVPAMTEHFRDASDSAFLFWFAFDRPLDDGSWVVDRILEAHPLLSDGERRYLEQMRTTAMMPYEVLSTRPGESVVLRRLGAQQEIEVRERTGSRIFKRWDMLVARLNPLGPSGGPEIEMGAMLIPRMVQKEIVELVRHELEQRLDGEDEVQIFKDLGEVLHTIWLETIVAPRLPMPVNAEGDPLVLVTMQFEVLDEVRARSALNAEPSLEGEHDTWSWVDGGSLLGTLNLAGSQLTFQAHSDARAGRGRCSRWRAGPVAVR